MFRRVVTDFISIKIFITCTVGVLTDKSSGKTNDNLVNERYTPALDNSTQTKKHHYE